MTRILVIVFAFHLIGGAAFFGVLYSAVLPLSIKVLCGLALTLFGVAWWAGAIEQTSAFSFHLRTAALLMALSRNDQEAQRVTQDHEALREHLNCVTTTGVRGREWSLFRYTIGMVAFWLLAGYVVSRYLP